MNKISLVYKMDEQNYSHGNSLVSNDTGKNDSTSELFRTPFQEPFTSLIFIICFAIVFAACVIGKS